MAQTKFVQSHSLNHQKICSTRNKTDFPLFQTKEENGKYYFKCQHGEEECYANKVHACAIEAVSNMTTAVKITDCMIADNLDADAALKRVIILVISKNVPFKVCCFIL